MCCVNMEVYGNGERVLCMCVCVCVWPRGHRWRKKEGERGERKWDRQQQYKLSTCSVLLLLSAATEGKRRRSPTPISTQSTCRRPCSSWIRRPLPLFVCLVRRCPAAISLQPVPGYTATSAEVPFHQMPIFSLPSLCQKCDGSQLRFTSVNHVKRSLWQGSRQNMTRLISMWETFSLFNCDDDGRLENHISIMEGTVSVKWTLAKLKWSKWTWAVP